MKLLGININSMSSFHLHISDICRKASRKLSVLARVSNFLPIQKRKLIFNTFVQSQFAYCPLLWMFHERNIPNKINCMHERALRLIYRDDEFTFKDLVERDEAFTIHERNLQLLLKFIKLKTIYMK